jgi:hypothetical protein
MVCILPLHYAGSPLDPIDLNVFVRLNVKRRSEDHAIDHAALPSFVELADLDNGSEVLRHGILGDTGCQSPTVE